MHRDPVKTDTSRIAYGAPAAESALATNKVLRNTYILLSMTLLFSAAMAGVSMYVQLPPFGPFVFIGGYLALLFLTAKFRDSSVGLACVFALTGFMGLTLGPILNLYLATSAGTDMVLTSLGITGLTFLALSVFTVKTQKDFSFMRGFILVGCLALVGIIVAGFFVDLSAYQLAISAAVVLLMCGLILYQTSEIIHGGETNYIMATVTLYVALYNIFLNLLMLMGIGGDD